MKLLKIIESTYLCLRFPFLYPRNRFTGLHHTNWKLQTFVDTWRPQTQDTFFFMQETEKKGWPSIAYGNRLRSYIIFVKDGKVRISNGKKIIWEKPFSYFGEGEILGVTKNDKNTLLLCTSKDFKKDENNSWFATYTHAKWLARICKIANWINKHPVQWFHCIPTFTELDAMETGWREAFGIQMCKEVKACLKKNNYLKQYRITQIKEKFGTLRWYDAGAPRELYDIINKYENLSYRTCIVCGRPAKYISHGWISPYCEDCIGDRDADPIDKTEENDTVQ